jgi:hypothetical protein
MSSVAAIAKIETTGPPVSAPSQPRTAHAHPKREKASKARNTAQTPIEQSSTGTPPPLEQPARQGNPLLRALRAAAEPSQPQPVKPSPAPPAKPATQHGNPLLRAVSDAFKRLRITRGVIGRVPPQKDESRLSDRTQL